MITFPASMQEIYEQSDMKQRQPVPLIAFCPVSAGAVYQYVETLLEPPRNLRICGFFAMPFDWVYRSLVERSGRKAMSAGCLNWRNRSFKRVWTLVRRSSR